MYMNIFLSFIDEIYDRFSADFFLLLFLHRKAFVYRSWKDHFAKAKKTHGKS
jgi:hypothetical protein